MTDQLLTGPKAWKAITAAAQRRPTTAFVATPYFGKAGARLLPLERGSRLVVNASMDALRSGQTCPQALLHLHRRGVAIYSEPRLHAKVYVFGTLAFIGSANASDSSANTLIEAVLQSAQRETVQQCREFVRQLTRKLVPAGEEQIKAWTKVYREPRHTQPRAPSSKRVRSYPRVWIVHVHEDAPPEQASASHDRGMAEAERAARRRHEVECFWHPYDSPYQRGDTVIEVFHPHSGKVMVIPPATVIRRHGWRHGRRRLTFVYTERPPGRRIDLDRLAKVLGRGAKVRLSRGGAVGDNAFRDELLAYFSERH